MNYDPIIFPGSKVSLGDSEWTVGAVGATGGERYYWLTRGDGEVAMMPAFMVEPKQ